jgi:hypothetical protein
MTSSIKRSDIVVCGRNTRKPLEHRLVVCGSNTRKPLEHRLVVCGSNTRKTLVQELVGKLKRDEVPTQTFKRLKKMWYLHTKQKIFGITCGEHWE